ncbi:unnamed protein product [Cyprideis torosa]|uniref:Uncharacterized protein n=1 Tax=Cyprideis torosa TaxID=163714 RepID=A0A7R8W255_9CRUS|nr:unnamed protein product [Cyprideis torosa]CAG0881618.1 unnamed protein product [Cyprideis torosa]
MYSTSDAQSDGPDHRRFRKVIRVSHNERPCIGDVLAVKRSIMEKFSRSACVEGCEIHPSTVEKIHIRVGDFAVDNENFVVILARCHAIPDHVIRARLMSEFRVDVRIHLFNRCFARIRMRFVALSPVGRNSSAATIRAASYARLWALLVSPARKPERYLVIVESLLKRLSVEKLGQVSLGNKFVICKQYSVEVRHRAAAMASKKNSTGSQAGVDVQKAAYEEGLVLPCNEECGIIQRNRRLALGLQIRNPELSGKPGPPPYSDFVLEMARREPDFVDEIHAALSALVQRATEATGKSRVHEFPAMNRNKRRFIHEYSEHFGCESHAVDPEPNRSVVATAFKEKCYLPSVSVLGVVRKGQRQRTIPPPPAVGNRREVSESFAARFRSSTGSGKGVQSSASSAAPKIDYFNLED